MERILDSRGPPHFPVGQRGDFEGVDSPRLVAFNENPGNKKVPEIMDPCTPRAKLTCGT